jgi:hypothetical protein
MCSLSCMGLLRHGLADCGRPASASLTHCDLCFAGRGSRVAECEIAPKHGRLLDMLPCYLLLQCLVSLLTLVSMPALPAVLAVCGMCSDSAFCTRL